ncbi:unnamed protein product [Coffea canephora]|uniref:DH200=94 genomic scaffold, scaffold_266 n=1 Tax=Coffea canephora TaxID=49390 RepID=A0A068VDQ2_COFCA|nr:unnamed protein product [Coffea canephora]
MGTGIIVAENLTLTGSIGVVTGKFNLGKLYEKIGFNKEIIISRGRYAELTAAEQRPFRLVFVLLFDGKTGAVDYADLRQSADICLSLCPGIQKKGLILSCLASPPAPLKCHSFCIFTHTLHLEKKKGMIKKLPVTLVELVKPSPSLPEISTGVGNSLVGADRILKQLLDELAVSDGVQARMDGIMFQKLEGADYSSPILTMVKDYLGSL